MDGRRQEDQHDGADADCDDDNDDDKDGADGEKDDANRIVRSTLPMVSIRVPSGVYFRLRQLNPSPTVAPQNHPKAQTQQRARSDETRQKRKSQSNYLQSQTNSYMAS